MSGNGHDHSILKKVHGSFLAAAVALGLAASVANAQAGGGCPSHKPLTLDQVVQLVDQTHDEGRTIYLIDSCSVGFTLDPEAISRLVAAGASDQMMIELNRLTSDHLSLEEGRAQVAALEARESEIEKAVLAKRDAAQAKSDSEFKAKREAATHIPEKSQFESTAAYNERLQKAKEQLAQMDSQHHQEELAVDAKFAAQTQSETRPYRTRADFLKRLNYPVNDIPEYGKYDADTGQLSVRIGSDEYHFDRVPASDAETLYKNWSKVKASQPFVDDDLHTRVLTISGASITATGYQSKAMAAQQHAQTEAKIATMLSDAKARADARDFPGARSEYQAVLALDAQNQAAKDGIASVDAMVKRASDEAEKRRRDAVKERANQITAGEWVDVRTGLMWQIRDNGSEIGWADAVKHCQEARNGNHADWRLPTMQELFFLWEPGVTRTTPPGKSHMKFNPGAPTRPMLEKGAPAVPYHIAGGIELSAVGLWTTTPDPNRPGQYVAVTFFNRATDYAPFWKPFMRAVCVRP